MVMNTRIILADDHKIMRQGLRSLLEDQEGMEVVAEAENGHDAVLLAEKHAPDLIIMDISMPGLSGIEATRQILAQQPRIRIIALSMHSDRRFVAEMLSNGASAYLLKDCALEELTDAIETVMNGQTYVSQGMAKIVIKDYLHEMDVANSHTTRVLTEREENVLRLLSEGMSTKGIASELGVSIKTVETHRQHIMDKLGIHSIAELTKFAIRRGLTSLDK